jgi:processive 1,2-diacylglycerol beta-glucosyltransferase
MEKRILIISTSAGTGHVGAATALEKAFRSDTRVADVRHEDALNFTNNLFRDFYSKLYETMIHARPGLLGWFYKNSDEPRKTDAVRVRLDRLNTGPSPANARNFYERVIQPLRLLQHRGVVEKLQEITATDDKTLIAVEITGQAILAR